MEGMRPVFQPNNSFLFSREFGNSPQVPVPFSPSLVSNPPPQAPVFLRPPLVSNPPPQVPVPVMQSMVPYSRDSNTKLNTLAPNVINVNNSIQNAINNAPWQMSVGENNLFGHHWNVEGNNQLAWQIPAEFSTYNPPWSVEEVDAITRNQFVKIIKEVIASHSGGNMLMNNPVAGITPVNDGNIELLPYGSINPTTSSVAAPPTQKTDFAFGKIPSAPPQSVSSGSRISSVNPPSVGVTNTTAVSRPEVNLNRSNLQPKPVVNTGTDGKKPRSIDENESDSNADEEDDEDENLDDSIITRLRKQALLLKELGGDIPKELLSVLDDSKTAEDIIAEIEKEIPPDCNDDEYSKMDIDNDKSKSACTPLSTRSVRQSVPIDDDEKEADTKEPQPSRNARSVPLDHKTQMNTQKINLSAQAKELAETSRLAANARATSFVNTVDRLNSRKREQLIMEKRKSVSNLSEPARSKYKPSRDREESFKEEQRRERLENLKQEQNISRSLESHMLPETSQDTMTMREDSTEAEKQWLKAITENILDTINEQLGLVEAQAESVRILNESAARISAAVAKLRGHSANMETNMCAEPNSHAEPNRQAKLNMPAELKKSLPYQKEYMCHICGKLGHWSEECKFYGTGLRRCYECHKMTTHTAEECRQNKMETNMCAEPNSHAKPNRQAKLNMPAELKKSLPYQKEYTCHICGKLGHWSEECKFYGTGLRRCYECHKMTTHTAEECRQQLKTMK